MSSPRKLFLFRMTRETLFVAGEARSRITLRRIDDQRDHNSETDSCATPEHRSKELLATSLFVVVQFR